MKAITGINYAVLFHISNTSGTKLHLTVSWLQEKDLTIEVHKIKPRNSLFCYLNLTHFMDFLEVPSMNRVQIKIALISKRI